MLAATMLKQNLNFNRADRISALGRLTLTVPTLAAALFDPPQPQIFASYVIGLLIGYTALAAVVAAVMWQRPLSARPIGQWVHGIDLLAFAALVYLTNGVVSPFFPLYLFTTLSATLRWDWRGALGTSTAIILLFIPAALFIGGGFDPDTDDLLRFVVRIGQIIVVGALLTYVGVQRERYWRELLRLSRPIDTQAASITVAIKVCLAHVREFFAVPTAIFVWEMRDEPGWRIIRDGAGPPLAPLPGPGWPGPVRDTPAGSTFDFHATAGDCRCYGSDGELVTIHHQLLDPAIAAVWGFDQAIATSIASDALDGWLIVPKQVADDDLYLARALSVQLAAALNNAAAAETWRNAAASEERVRVAHDLHDGILQFLTGLALQLRLMERQIKSNPEAVATRIQTMATALRQEQQDLRGLLERIRPRQPAAAESGRPMTAWIPMLAEQWDISIDADISAEPPAGLADEIRLITREAIANAVRHGAARHVAIRSEQASGVYSLAIADNGSGFGVVGHYTAAGLRDNNIGPRSILTRLDRLGGRLILETSPKGTRLDMMFSGDNEGKP